MSVLIKDMKMPPSCYFCGLTDTSFINCQAFSPSRLLDDDCEERRPDWCPLVDLGKHGRLIDVDALVTADICHDWNGCVLSDDYSEECTRKAPPVIEAEGEG